MPKNKLSKSDSHFKPPDISFFTLSIVVWEPHKCGTSCLGGIALKKWSFQAVELPDCCASGQVVPGQYDHCGCLKSCGPVCARPEGFPCDIEGDPCAEGTLCQINEVLPGMSKIWGCP